MDKARGKLEVAPCFLPTVAAGPYWVLDYSEEEGYALISGAWRFVFSAIFLCFLGSFDNVRQICAFVGSTDISALWSNANITMENHHL